MMLDVESIREKLTILAGRDWPAEWGAHEAATVKDFLGWGHRYKFADTLTEIEVEAFEKRFEVNLPKDYRQFLLELGNGGAGPACGVYRLGDDEEGPLPEMVLQNLASDFSFTGPWNDADLLGDPEQYYSDDLMAGAMPITSDGCSLAYWLVVSGPCSGQIWLDKRTDDEGIAPMTTAKGEPLFFGEWYSIWLDDVWSRFGP